MLRLALFSCSNEATVNIGVKQIDGKRMAFVAQTATDTVEVFFRGTISSHVIDRFFDLLLEALVFISSWKSN